MSGKGSHEKRRGSSRPNRGGGKFHGGGGGGRGGGRGRGGGGGRGGGRGGRGGSGGGGGGGGGGGMEGRKAGSGLMASAYYGDAVLFAKETYSEPEFRPQPKREKTKVPMQKLHMSVENQEMVKDMLKDLHGGEDLQQLEDFDEDTYDELDWRAEEQYWVSDSKMKVEEAAVFSPETSNISVATFSRVALLKLQRYGFEKVRCQDALEVFEGDIGKSLELLLSQCFELRLNIAKAPKSDGEYDAYDEDYTDSNDSPNDTSLEEILEQREEEKVALESIYPDTFSERIPNSVWCINLELPHLTDLLKQKKDIKLTKVTTVLQKLKERRKEKESTELCRFFLKGNCKFGNRCRQRHQAKNPDAEGSLAFTNDVPDDYCPYCLEIRFPPGNKYPSEPPFVAFYSANDDLPNATVLNITSRLVTEAKDQAKSGCPAVFSMASILDDVTEIKHLLEEEPLPYSLPAPVISRIHGEYTVRKQQEVQAITNKGQSSELRTLMDKQKEYLTRPNKDDAGQNGEEDDEDEDEKLKPEDLRKRYALKDVVQRSLDPREIERINLRLKEQFRRKQNQDSYKNMLATRQKLPAWESQDKIKQILHSNQVMVVSGMTGCGKTTQVPQFILDSHLKQKGSGVCNIVCTQPRRISAMAVAERVADERTERLGGIVGYQIRLESVMSSRTRLLFCTTGILLRRLESDMSLEGVTHVIIDEVHERSEDSDFLMMVLRDLLPRRRDLKVLLMSATMNAELFSEYFGQCPMVEIPGRTFHVDQFFLEDAIECTGYMIDERSPFSRPLKRANAVRQGSTRPCVEEIIEDLETCNVETLAPPKDNIQDQNLSVKQLFKRYGDYQKTTIKTMATMDHERINNDLVEALIEWIIGGDHEFPRDGAILVFLPGIAEITSVYEQLLSHRSLGGKNKNMFRLIPLHSTLSSEEQQAVFRPSREGVTKIVLATNIAETSITIDDVVYVIDCGRMKEKRYDPTKGMESLETVWVSRANAQQRKGRAGRVAEGICFHLFTGHRYEYHMRDQPIPEIQRVPLESLVLKIKLLDIFTGQDVKEVLLKLVESPSGETVELAIKRLQDLGALDPSGDLTPLGYHLGQLPVDVRIGKLMLFGAIFQCLDPALTIAATLSFKSPFVAPFEKRDEADRKRKEFAVGNSDHLTMLKAYKGWTEAQKHGNYSGYSYCQENFLSIKTLQMLGSMKRQFTELLSDIGFIQEGLTVRDIERRGREGSDGVREASGPIANANSENSKLVGAILVAALYPNVVQVLTPEAKYQQTSEGAVAKMFKPEDLKFKTKPDGYISLHPSSINFQVRYFESPYLVYHEKVKTSKVYIRDSTMVSVYPLLLFGGGAISIDMDRGKFILSVDEGWIRFMAASHQIAELVKELRIELDHLLQDKIETPNMDLCTCPRGSKIIPTIVKLVSTQ